jgi:lysine 6-dehydrogenase
MMIKRFLSGGGTMSNNPVYAVIGCGMQGVAEAYDLSVFGKASLIVMVDRDFSLAYTASARINRLAGRTIATPVELDASDISNVVQLLNKYKVTVCCGAAHYALNLLLSQASLEAGAHFCDMGGNTGVVMQQHELHDAAVSKGIGIVPDCGIAPGTANILAARAMKHIQCESVQIYCGGLPQSRELPLGYRIVFSISGLTNEYTGHCSEIRNGKIVSVPAFNEKEELVLPEPVGQCEAFLTSGGTSTGPLSFHGKVNHYGYKTVRYPGHYNLIRTMIDMGFLDLNPVKVDGKPIVPRNMFHALAGKYWHYPDEPDLLVLQVVAKGLNDKSEPVVMTQDLMDFQDKKTGFTAMERTTAFSAAIVAESLAFGKLDSGVLFLESAIDPDQFVDSMAKRNLNVSTLINVLK